MTSEHLSYKDFVFKFDVVTGGISCEENYSDNFLRYLSEPIKGFVLDEKYLLIFPLYYDFKVSTDRKPILYLNEDTPYQWWIHKDIINAVESHSAYGLGITESYCRSDVGPSYLEITKKGEKEMMVEIHAYDSFAPGDTGLDLTVRTETLIESRGIQEAKSAKLKDWDLKDVKVRLSSTKDDICTLLYNDSDFIKGIKSHYPIVNEKHTHLYYFFSNNLNLPDGRYGFGGLFVITEKKLKGTELGFFMLASFTLANKIAQSQLQRAARMEATKSAIAKAMARNMSHNIGSHVLSNLIKDNIFYELSDENVIKLNSFTSTFERAIQEEGKELQLSYFLRYLKSRMDYLSEVTFGTPNLSRARMVYNDVLGDFDKVRILLNYISGISAFQYQFRVLNGRDLMQEKDLAVSFPGDVLGCQAFYNIIENIVRNTAKHAHHDGKVTITIRFRDMDNLGDIEGADNLYCVEIDNGVIETNIDKIVTGQNHRLNESVLDNNNNLRDHSLGLLEMEASAAFLRQIDLQEIESENYDVDDDDSYYHERNGKKRLNIIKAFALPEDERDKGGRRKGVLGYRFFLQKAKVLLFVTDCWHPDIMTEKKLKNCGILFLTFDVFLTRILDGEAFAHQILILDRRGGYSHLSLSGEADLSILDASQNKTLLPLRRLLLDEKEVNHVINIINCPEKSLLDSICSYVWEKYSSEEDVEDYVFFLSHGTMQEWKDSKKSKLLVENMLSKAQERLPQYDRYCCKQHERSEVLLRKYLDSIYDEKNEIQKELCEAYLNKVLIIDERVQRFAEEGREEDIPCWALFQTTNVLIPRSYHTDKDNSGNLIAPLDEDGFPIPEEDILPLDPDDFKRYKERVEKYIQSHINDAVLLIHYGVLERMYNQNKLEINNQLCSWAGVAKRVVVTSGRGAHSLDLPETVCFVNLSSVLYACVENRNKYLLYDLLCQSRRKRT